MRAGCEREQRGGRPTEEERDWVRQQRANPTEVCAYVARALEPGIALGAECAGEENRKKKKYNAANLAGER